MYPVSIFHTTDMHGHMELFPLLNQIKEKELLFDSGDAIKGSNIFYYNNEPILKSMNSIPYKAMALGNREFNYSSKVFKKRLESLKFPAISANLTNYSFKELIKQFISIKYNELKVAVTALSPIQFSTDSFLVKLSGSKFLPYEEALEKLFKNDEFKNSDLKILLSHAGFNEDLIIAEKYPNINIILGGHSHLRFRSPIVRNNVYICQSGALGKSIGNYRFNFKDGCINSFTTEHIEV